MSYAPDGKFIAAPRSDGLGARLNALMIAMALSQGLGLPFRFTWEDNKQRNPHHAIRAATETFCPDFLRQHWIECIRGSNPLTFDELLDAGLREGYFRVPLRVTDVSMQHPQAQQILHGLALRPFFERIGFAHDVAAAVYEAARAAFPAHASAVHLRAGDVVYGSFRRTGFHINKVIAWPVAIELIRSIASEGPVIVFAQDGLLGAYIRERCGVMLSSDLLPDELPPLQYALCDIVLMSRCERIFAGNSGFSLAAAMIAWGGEPIDPGCLMTPEQRVATIRATLCSAAPVEGVSPHQQAFACLQALVQGWRLLSYADSRELVARARGQDSANQFLTFLEIVLHLRNGQPAAADRVLEALSAEELTELAAVLDWNFFVDGPRQYAGKMGFKKILNDWAGLSRAADQLSNLIRREP